MASTLKSSAIISTLSLLQVILTFIFQIIIANIFSIGHDLDIFFASNTINLILSGVASSSINYALTPIMIKYYRARNYKLFNEISYSIFNIAFILFFFIAIIQYIFAQPIIRIILPGFDGEKFLTTVFFFRIQAFLSIFTVLTGILIAIHYTLKQFYRTIFFPIIAQIGYILFVFLTYKRLGLYSLLYGLIINQMISFIGLGITFIHNYKLNIVFNEELRNALVKIYPLLFSASFSKSNILIDRFFASTVGDGKVTLLHYGRKIIQLLTTLINKGISIVTLYSFSLYQEDEKKFQSQFLLTYKGMVFILFPTLFFIIFFLKDFLNIILLSNKLTSVDITNIYLVTLAFVGVFIGGCLSSVIVNAFYAKGLTKLVSKLSITIQIIGILLKIGLFLKYGFFGLPVAFSIQSIANTLVLMMFYYKSIYRFNIGQVLLYLGKIVLICFLAIVIPYILIGNIDFWLYRILLGTITFFMIFLIISFFIEKEISKAILLKLKLKLA